MRLKVIIRPDLMVMQELLLEGSDDTLPSTVVRERKCTPKELLVWHTGYGRELSFDKVIN